MHNDWCSNTVREIEKYKAILVEKEYKRYRLNLLIRVAKRVAGFSGGCDQCQAFQLGSPTSAIEGAGRLLPNLEADIIPDAGHLLSLDQPELVTARILEFLRE